MTHFKAAENSMILIVVNSQLSDVARKARIAFANMEKMDIMIVKAPKEIRAINYTEKLISSNSSAEQAGGLYHY